MVGTNSAGVANIVIFAPADRVVLFHFAANRSQRLVGRQTDWLIR